MSDESTWFPRPRSPKDLRPLGPSGELGVDELFALLVDPDGHEWRERVGVTSPADGSAKPTTRLLRVRGWVFKTDTGQADHDRATVQERLTTLLATAHRLELWHPDKRWLLLRTHEDGERWWPVSVCPELTTLRSITDWSTGSRAWAQALALALELSQLHGIGLDLGPANFGFAAAGSPSPLEIPRIWYLDDELYDRLELGELAQAIAQRIPEQPTIEPEQWRSFAAHLRALLQPLLPDPTHWRELVLQVGDSPLAERYSPARAALLAGLQPERRERSARQLVAGSSRRTAIIADVHANLPALEAVIAAAEAAGVDDWLFLGDAVGYGPHPQECIERLTALPHLRAIRGNHDHMLCFGGEQQANRLARISLQWARTRVDAAARRWLMELPVELLEPTWLAVHGAPVDPMRFGAYVYSLSYRMNLELLAEGERPLCFYGHTHVPMIYRMRRADRECEALALAAELPLALADALALLVNPGSVGQPRDGDRRASFVIWERERGLLRWHRVGYPVARTIAALHAAGLPEDLVHRLELGR